jgi:hypothetical protein
VSATVTTYRIAESKGANGHTYPASTVVEADGLAAYIDDDGVVSVGDWRVDRAAFSAWLDACRTALDTAS